MLCGTTNRDEGSYIGFFGKASDGMVDLQLISDLHKSEVYQLARLLEISEIVINAVPTGDTYNGMLDEEMIGTSYDFLELYEWWLCEDESVKDQWLQALNDAARREFNQSGAKLETLHLKNKHKYIGDSPAAHFDLYPRAVPGGWRSQERENSKPSPITKIQALVVRVGPVELPSNMLSASRVEFPSTVQKQGLLDFGDSAFLAKAVLSEKACSAIVNEAISWSWVEADSHGRPIDTESLTTARTSGPRDSGSYRATAFDESLAQQIWERIAPVLPIFRVMNELTSTDHYGYPVWRPVGINPMLRFIRYERGGHLVPHYDAGFDYQNDRHHTLMSVIITLTQSTDGDDGSTRFLIDRQRNVPVNERHFEDWDRLARDDEVLLEVTASQGDAIVFDHRQLHDFPFYPVEDSRIILRTDVIFERCGYHAIHWDRLVPDAYDLDRTLPHAKWAQDPTYRKAYSVLGNEEAIEHAGYYDDGLTGHDLLTSMVWTAPLGVLFHNLSLKEAQNPSSPLAVLVTTGGLCPLHTGHINMMELAKKAAQKAGKVVLAGFFVPDHDSYVSIKLGSKSISAAYRVHLAEETLREVGSDWLMIDHWSALYASSDANFTTLVDRISAQLAFHVRTARPIEVIYVCGGDNARFSLSFVERGQCIVVPRPGSERKIKQTKEHHGIQGNPRITFADGIMSDASSTAIRNGDTRSLPDKIVEKFRKIPPKRIFKSTFSRIDAPKPIKAVHLSHTNFYMRHEGDFAVTHWSQLPHVNAKHVAEAYNSFCIGLVDLFRETFERAQLSGGPKVHIIPLHLESQRLAFQTSVQETYSKSQIISLDPCIPAKHNLAISRCFEPLGGDTYHRYVARPNSEPLETQLDRIAIDLAKEDQKQHVVLFDDDSHSGRTAAAVMALLKSHSPLCTVDKFITLLDLKQITDNPSSEPEYERLDVVDCRDFLVGSREGGSVVSLPFGDTLPLCRVPYTLPFVRPVYRASIPVDEEVGFSRKVWKLNRTFFAKFESLTLADMGGNLQAILGFWLGAHASITMEEVSARMLELVFPDE